MDAISPSHNRTIVNSNPQMNNNPEINGNSTYDFLRLNIFGIINDTKNVLCFFFLLSSDRNVVFDLHKNDKASAYVFALDDCQPSQIFNTFHFLVRRQSQSQKHDHDTNLTFQRSFVSYFSISGLNKLVINNNHSSCGLSCAAYGHKNTDNATTVVSCHLPRKLSCLFAPLLPRNFKPMNAYTHEH